MVKRSLFVIWLLGISFWSSGQKKTVPSGELVYANNCSTCHQTDGNGVRGLYPPLSKTSWVLGDKKKLIAIVIKGMKEPLEIEGEYYESPMPSQAHLNDQEVASVLTYIRSHFGNKASAVTALEVKNSRATK